ncbi:MAG TPA: hypothetical protein ACQGQI_04355 [Xylella sp.]
MVFVMRGGRVDVGDGSACSVCEMDGLSKSQHFLYVWVGIVGVASIVVLFGTCTALLDVALLLGG